MIRKYRISALKPFIPFIIIIFLNGCKSTIPLMSTPYQWMNPNDLCIKCYSLDEVMEHENNRGSVFIGKLGEELAECMLDPTSDYREYDFEGLLKAANSTYDTLNLRFYLFYQEDKITGYKILKAYEIIELSNSEKRSLSFYAPCNMIINSKYIKYFDYDECFASQFPQYNRVTKGYVNRFNLYEEWRDYLFKFNGKLKKPKPKRKTYNITGLYSKDHKRQIISLMKSQEIRLHYSDVYFRRQLYFYNIDLLPNKRSHNSPLIPSIKFKPKEFSFYISFETVY